MYQGMIHLDRKCLVTYFLCTIDIYAGASSSKNSPPGFWRSASGHHGQHWLPFQEQSNSMQVSVQNR